jgi:hypothetical protein
MWNLGQQLGLDREATMRITEYLRGENLLRHQGLGGTIGITHYGIIEIEQALSTPNQATQHFPAYVNIVQVMGDVVDSQIQQAGQAKTQIQVNEELQNVLSKFMIELDREISELKLETDEQRNLIANIETIKAQLKGSEPKHSIIKEALSSIKRVLEGVGAALLAAKAAELLTRLA